MAFTPAEMFRGFATSRKGSFKHGVSTDTINLEKQSVRGVHLPDYTTTNRLTSEYAARQRTYENFCTALNTALHKDDYAQDIYSKDIIKQLEKMLKERKHVVGPGGLVERGKTRRITRALTNAWNRGSQMNFDGSMGEWEEWRKRALENESRRAKGLCSIEEEEEKKEAKKKQEQEAIATLQSKAYERRKSYAADDFISTMGSPPMASTPMPSPGRGNAQASSSFEVIQDSDNIVRPPSSHITSPSVKRRKLAGMRRRKNADLKASERADVPSSKPEQISLSFQRPVEQSSWEVGSEQLARDTDATAALSENQKKPERRDEYGRPLPDPDTYAVGATKFIDTS
ncbi:hypothetical protein M7I_1407 [Glarea lozoyensis 74030]|uniref:Uncharacterized protein n=1 Tax=Glarea lozoyensis (strain ATCC 74030 / MF5533) TaxID=1104152 RepID=H0EFZ9_GLAL7|nr:hypothetical protein M7I_1407 [Glarea lozoyensis 74030]